jgi:tryptophanyl-tRNA synthetase
MEPTLSRVVTGIKPTGEAHLGNYFGMMDRVIRMQEHKRVFCFIADYHALTTLHDPDAIRYNTYAILAAFLALGMDPSQVVLFRQSAVPEVHELAWLLSCMTGMGTLLRAHAFKAAEAEGRSLNVGTFTYPALMAADILLYQADEVPVGEDQHQHVQIAQEMARHLNATYVEEFFRQPKPLIQSGLIVPGNDGRKMSKSYGNTLPVMADPPQVRSFVKRIKTDSTPLEEPKDPSKCVVAQLHRLIAPPAEADAMDAKYRAGGFGYGHAKEALLAAHEARFGEAHTNYRRFYMDRPKIDRILAVGAEIAREEARKVLGPIRDLVGISPENTPPRSMNVR